MSRPMREEQQPPGTEVTEMAPGILRIQLPLAMPGLGHVNTYALVDEQGVALVDPGFPGAASWKTLTNGLRSAGLRLPDVHTVLVTHSHPDHFGNVGRLVRETGARFTTHAAFRTWRGPGSTHQCGHDLDEVEPEDLEVHHHGNRTPWGGDWFRPPLKRRLAMRAMNAVGRGWAVPCPADRVLDGAPLRLAGREWFAVHTPGHTLDHLCLYDPEGGVLLSGDHVLPTITPHIAGVGAGRDPLKAFFGSLDKVAGLEAVQKVLPAHGQPFSALSDRAEAIKRHHHERLEVLRQAALAMGPSSVHSLMRELFKPRSWGPMAESETYAHLEHMRLSGQARRTERDGMAFYEVGEDEVAAAG